MKRIAIFMTFTLGLFAVMPSSNAETILKITDGDTIRINTGEDVRLVQIDTPELKSSECYASESTAALAKLIFGKTIRLESEPVSANNDQYNRLLRYVFVGKTNVNLKMVEIGAAAPYFYNGEKGKYSAELLKAAQKARAQKMGLWGKCPGSKLDPTRSLSTGGSVKPAASPSSTATSNGNCDPNYDQCVPITGYDLNCPDIYNLGMSRLRVLGRDIHKLDRDRDGIACDSRP